MCTEWGESLLQMHSWNTYKKPSSISTLALRIQIAGLGNVRDEIVGRNEVEDLVENSKQNVLNGFGDDWSKRLRDGAPVLVQVIVGAVL